MNEHFLRHLLSLSHSTPVLTKLPAGYSNWETESDLSKEIDRLRAYIGKLEEYYVSEYQFVGMTAEQTVQEIRARFGVSDLFNKDTD